MSAIFIHGLGAVSPAGWGVAALTEAVKRGDPLPTRELVRPGWEKPLRIHAVPQPDVKPPFLAHPRLRRAGALSQHTVGAAVEALGDDVAHIQSGTLRLGIIVCMLGGSVAYSRKLYEEVLRDPATASPLIFPETVFNASASHLAAYLGSSAISYSLVGDDGTFLQGLALAADWLERGSVDGCIVAGVEEMDWIVADALRLFTRSATHSSGAGAVYLKRSPESSVSLAAVTDSFLFTQSQSRSQAVQNMRTQLGAGSPNELLCDNQNGNNAWRDWPGPRLTPKEILGEAFVASAAWLCVVACDAIRQRRVPAASVSIAGANQQAIGARFIASR